MGDWRDWPKPLEWKEHVVRGIKTIYMSLRDCSAAGYVHIILLRIFEQVGLRLFADI